MWIALLFTVAIIGVGVAVWLNYRLKQKRREGLFLFAQGQGLEYSREDTISIDRSYAFQLFGMGEGRGCENVLSGLWNGLPVREADYWYYTESTDGKGNTSKDYSYFSIVVADLTCAVPPISIQRETLFSRVAERMGFPDIPFESDAFNRAFRVRAKDRRFAYQLVDARMMQWLQTTGGEFGFEVVGPNLLAYCRRRRPTELIPLLGTAKLFNDHIPNLVRTEYGFAKPGRPGQTERSST
jgi:hypothetical protein